MKIKIQHNQLGGVSPAQWLRRAGYVLIIDHQSGQESFARRFNRDFYPRFHLYVQEIAGGELFFNLHLDHKKASYEGQSRHSADYDGELVEQEAARLTQLLLPAQSNYAPVSKEAPSVLNGDVLSTLKPSMPASSRHPEAKAKGWWQKLFS